MNEFLNQLSLVVIYGGILQGLFVVLLLNSGGVRKSRANLFLSILLIALSFSIFHIQYAGRVMNHFSIHVHSIGDPTFFLIAPLLWFYINELTGNKIRLNVKSVANFIPFIAIICFSLLSKFIISANEFSSLLNNHKGLVDVLFWVAVFVQFSVYQFFIHRKWLAYQKLIEQEVSNTEDVNISWVKFFMAVFLFINFFFLFSLFAAIHLENIISPHTIVAIVFSLSVFALGYKGILQKEIFGKTIGEPIMPDHASFPSPVDKKIDQGLITMLLAFMEDKKPYLNAELTLTGLANDLDISRNQLSYVINDGVGDNFYNFINKYRVEQVKKLMSDPKVQHYNMMGLALEAGFKSKSTFNLIFKRFTGLTPTEYRKNSTQ